MAGDKGCDDKYPLETRVASLIEQMKLETRVEVLVERMKRIEEKFDLKVNQISEGFASRDKALELQAGANNERLSALNHEAERILKATEITVSRDTWEEYLKADRAWKQVTDRMLQTMVPREEFQSYKDSTQQVLNLKAGQSQGVGMSMAAIVQVIASIATFATIITLAVALFRH